MTIRSTRRRRGRLAAALAALVVIPGIALAAMTGAAKADTGTGPIITFSTPTASSPVGTPAEEDLTLQANPDGSCPASASNPIALWLNTTPGTFYVGVGGGTTRFTACGQTIPLFEAASSLGTYTEDPGWISPSGFASFGTFNLQATAPLSINLAGNLNLPAGGGTTTVTATIPSNPDGSCYLGSNQYARVQVALDNLAGSRPDTTYSWTPYETTVSACDTPVSFQVTDTTPGKHPVVASYTNYDQVVATADLSVPLPYQAAATDSSYTTTVGTPVNVNVGISNCDPTPTLANPVYVNVVGAPGSGFAGSVSGNGYYPGCNEPEQFTINPAAAGTFTMNLVDQASGFVAGSFKLIAQPNAPPADTTPPTVTVVTTDQPNSAGWYNASNLPTFTTTGDDGTGSGVASCSAPQTYGGPDGANLTLTGQCTDNAGNIGTGTSAPFNVDTTAPVLHPSGTAQIVLNTSAAFLPNATDTGGSGIASASCAPVDTTKVGSGQDLCTAIDNAGNETKLEVPYSVIYTPSGTCAGDVGHAFRQPLNPDGSSVFSSKSTIVFKAAVCDANNVSIGTAGVITKFTVTQVSNLAPGATVDEAVVTTNGDTSFRWDPVAQQWVLNLSVKGTGLQSGVEYKATATLNDGSTISDNFGVK